MKHPTSKKLLVLKVVKIEQKCESIWQETCFADNRGSLNVGIISLFEWLSQPFAFMSCRMDKISFHLCLRNTIDSWYFLSCSNISPIIHVWSASQRDAIFLLYDNGVISMRCRKRLYTVANTPALAESESINQDPVLVRRYPQCRLND